MAARPIRHLSLFSGAGGGELAARLLGWRTVCYVEHDMACVGMLRARIRDGMLHDAPIWDDVSSFDGEPWRGRVDVLSGGFPCQPYSIAGKQRGADDERDCWPDTIRVIREVRPVVAFLENSPALLTTGRGAFADILRDLHESGFDAEWDCVPAAALGAPHRRDRLWILAARADADRDRLRLAQRNSERRRGLDRQRGPDAVRFRDAVSDTDGQPVRLKQERIARSDKAVVAGQHGQEEQVARSGPNAVRLGLERFDHARPEAWTADIRRGARNWWEVEPPVGRVAHGVANRVDQIRALGNGQVPRVAASAFRALLARLTKE